MFIGLALAGGLFAGFGAPVRVGVSGSGELTVRDELGQSEVSEVTALTIDGVLVTTFRLDRNHASDRITVPVTDPSHVTYILCGEVAFRDGRGRVVRHAVDGTGVLTEAAGRIYDASTTDDYTTFFLTDITPSRPAAPVDRRPIRVCDRPVA